MGTNSSSPRTTTFEQVADKSVVENLIENLVLSKTEVTEFFC